MKVMVMTVAINCFIIMLVVAGLGVYRFCLTSPYFSVTNIEITGNVILKKKEILKLSNVVFGENIFNISLSSIHNAIESHPMVKWVSVEKNYPSGIKISIAERVPFALLKHKNGHYVIDREGYVLMANKINTSFLPHFFGFKLKKIPDEGMKILDKRLAKGIEILTIVKREHMDNITAVDIKEKERSILVASGSDLKIIINNNQIEKNINKYKMLYKVLKNRINQTETINFFFKDMAVVTWSRSS